MGRFRISAIANEAVHLQATIIPPHIALSETAEGPVIGSYPGTGGGGIFRSSHRYDIGFASGAPGGPGGYPAARPAAAETHDVTTAAGNTNVTVPLWPD
jgi:hypothetical protein